MRYVILKANHNNISIMSKVSCVVYQIKDTIFWKQITTNIPTSIRLTSCLSDQRYNFLKANHNYVFHLLIKFGVVYQIKDTIFWKQITTGSPLIGISTWLFIRSKIQFFESKSQHTRQKLLRMFRCLSDQRYIPIFYRDWIQITKKARCKPRFKCFHNGIILIVICFKNCTANILHLFQNKSFFS